MNSNLIELLSTLNAHHVEYLVVGAHALAVYGHVRATKDLDVWVNPAPGNAEKVFHALAEFGAPMLDLTVGDLAQPGITYQIGLPPLRVDVITSVSGVDFDPAWSRRHQSQLNGLDVWIISREDLIANKRAAGRAQDLVDIERLEELPPSE